MARNRIAVRRPVKLPALFFSGKFLLPPRLSYQPCKDGFAMILKFLRFLLRFHASNLPQSRLPLGFEWQSEFLFLPAKPALRDDTDSRAMTRRAFVPRSRKSHFQGL